MKEVIVPAFNQYPEEMATVGRLLSAYGELEYELHICLGKAIGSRSDAARAVFRVRGEENRIKLADALMRDKYSTAGLAPEYERAIKAMRFCRIIRNQFAHCHWFCHPAGVLAFVNFESAATEPGPGDLTLTPRPISKDLLAAHEAYFLYTFRCLWFLSHEYEFRAAPSPSHGYSMPEEPEQPPQYIGQQQEARQSRREWRRQQREGS